MSEKNLILEKIDEFGQGVVSLREKFDTRFDELSERVELIEAQRDRPRISANDEGVKYRTFYDTDDKAQYAVPHDTKLSDIPGLQKGEKTDISLDRWLRAIATGDRCRDGGDARRDATA